MSVLENDVFKFLHVPSRFGERLEAVGQHANFVFVPDAHFKVVLHWLGCVNPVLFVNFALTGELLDNAHGFDTDCRLSLIGAGSTMVCAVDTWMACQRVLPLSSFGSRLALEDIKAAPKVRA